VKVTAIQRWADGKAIALIGSQQIAKSGRQCNWQEEDIDGTVRTFGEWIYGDMATEMALIYRLCIHHFWNALKESRESKSLAELALVLMTRLWRRLTMNERIFWLKRGIIRIHATRASPDLLPARAPVKVPTDPK
jgi:hypothetical protein